MSDALQLIDVFDTHRALERFAATLLPILRELGITARPEVHEAYKIIRG